MVFPATIANVYFFMSYRCVPAMIDATSPIIGNQGEKKITTAQPYLFIMDKLLRSYFLSGALRSFLRYFTLYPMQYAIKPPMIELMFNTRKMAVEFMPPSSSADVVTSVGIGINEENIPLKKSPMRPYFIKKVL